MRLLLDTYQSMLANFLAQLWINTSFVVHLDHRGNKKSACSGRPR